jgi:NTE family protein
MQPMPDVMRRREPSADDIFDEVRPDGPCIGLALGGGAAFGGMHVGVIKALHEAGIEADAVTGTSAGAFVGAFYAGGATPEHMAELAGRLRWAQLRRHVLPVRALMSNDRMAAWLRRHLPVTDFEGMPKPFAVVATDILHGSMVVLSAARFHGRTRTRESSMPDDGEKCASQAASAGRASHGIVWESAPVPEAVAASCAIPVIFEPVRIGDRLLVDGGASNMVPATVARWLGADVVIGVDILPPQQAFTAPRTIVEYAIQAHRISSQWAVRNRTINADVVLYPRAVSGEWNDMRRMRELVEIGYAEASAALPEIRRKLGLVEAMKRRLAGQVAWQTQS